MSPLTLYSNTAKLFCGGRSQVVSSGGEGSYSKQNMINAFTEELSAEPELWVIIPELKE